MSTPRCILGSRRGLHNLHLPCIHGEYEEAEEEEEEVVVEEEEEEEGGKRRSGKGMTLTLSSCNCNLVVE